MVEATGPEGYDFSTVEGCKLILEGLLKAYMEAITGNKRVHVRFQDRESKFESVDAAGLLTLYNQLYRQCPDTTNLPDLSPGLRARRGPPSRGLFRFPRM